MTWNPAPTTDPNYPGAWVRPHIVPNTVLPSPAEYRWPPSDPSKDARLAQQETLIARLQHRVSDLEQQAHELDSEIETLNVSLNQERQDKKAAIAMAGSRWDENLKLNAIVSEHRRALDAIADLIDSEYLSEFDGDPDYDDLEDDFVEAVKAAIDGAKSDATMSDKDKAYEEGRLAGRKEMSSISDDERKQLQATIDNLNKRVAEYGIQLSAAQTDKYDLANLKRILAKP